MDLIDIIDEAHKEFINMVADTHGRGNGKSLGESIGISYVTVFVNYLKGKIQDEHSDDRKEN